jgi:hypothetical protein
MRTSFHHQPEAQHPNFPLSTSRQADYPIFRGTADMAGLAAGLVSVENDPYRGFTPRFRCSAADAERS